MTRALNQYAAVNPKNGTIEIQTRLGGSGQGLPVPINAEEAKQLIEALEAAVKALGPHKVSR